MEIRKDVKGYEGLYMISNLGNIKSIKRRIEYVDGRHGHVKERILRPYKVFGYNIVTMCRNNQQKHYQSHRLVGEMFIPNPDCKGEINHKNGIVDDNRVENLEWVTHSENMIHAYRVLKINTSHAQLGKIGKDHPRSKRIKQKNIKGECIKIRDSISDIKRSGYFGKGIINNALKNHSISYGYIWEYDGIANIVSGKK